jgi:DNA-binding LacI/PurR family transcriptional regulator
MIKREDSGGNEGVGLRAKHRCPADARVKTYRIGVLISRITNPFFASLVDALEVTARKNGYSVLIVQNHDSAGEKNCLDLLKKKIIDGLILCAVENDKNVLENISNMARFCCVIPALIISACR